MQVPDANLRLVFWELTSACNLKCVHCRAEAGVDPTVGELSTEQILMVARDIREAGDPIIVLTGGEPLSRPDIFDIAAAMSGIFTRVALATNGTLIDDAMAGRIKDSGIQRVSISLDGACSRTHDSFRGQPGSFAAALRGICALREQGVQVQINSTISARNVRELDDMIQLAMDKGACAFHVFALVPVGCGATLPADVQLNPEQLESMLSWLLDRSIELQDRLHIKATCAPQYYRLMRQRRGGMKALMSVTGGHGGHATAQGGAGRVGHDAAMNAVTRGCLAGSGVCFISRTGQVQPCGYLPIAAGQVLDTPFQEIWHGSGLFHELRNADHMGGKCGDCEFRRVCQGCRARAYAETGDALAADPDCLYQPMEMAR